MSLVTRSPIYLRTGRLCVSPLQFGQSLGRSCGRTASVQVDGPYCSHCLESPAATAAREVLTSSFSFIDWTALQSVASSAPRTVLPHALREPMQLALVLKTIEHLPLSSKSGGLVPRSDKSSSRQRYWAAESSSGSHSLRAFVLVYAQSPCLNLNSRGNPERVQVLSCPPAALC